MTEVFDNLKAAIDHNKRMGFNKNENEDRADRPEADTILDGLGALHDIAVRLAKLEEKIERTFLDKDEFLRNMEKNEKNENNNHISTTSSSLLQSQEAK